jgi:hypothetical protein
MAADAATALYSAGHETTVSSGTEPRDTARGSPPFGSRSLARASAPTAVTPANAGVQWFGWLGSERKPWIPAFAGMTKRLLPARTGCAPSRSSPRPAPTGRPQYGAAS